MRHIIIGVDGELHEHEGPIDFRAILGPEGRAQVRLRPQVHTAGWVNDCGLLFPDRYPRNVVGSCVLAALGARPQPYAGTVILTGWEARNTARGLLEICPLQKPAQMYRDVHFDIRRALVGKAVPGQPPAWADQIRDFAAHVGTAPTPGITLSSTQFSATQGGDGRD